ncbi:MAG: hypothetical protein E5Y34_27665 [Mesorhizobium sp.]|uniref:hypothetical protein n=1 Tax=Mesorhizobium sp. TaxID=1871066 RepID=UPI00122180BB|nr:hypothetical protein [Mesorhizobium sp.]TIM95059.1 MAG: hypothetical protein E5Y34_27665 [Mesorhizobium sp.]
MRLTELERTAIMAWQDTQDDFDVLSFDAIADRSALPRKMVRRTVRAMARKGVTRYVRGCWTEDGEPAGSGYGLTPIGRLDLLIEAKRA